MGYIGYIEDMVEMRFRYWRRVARSVKVARDGRASQIARA